MNAADLVKDTSTSVGAGNIVTSGSPTPPYRDFSTIGPVGAAFGYKLSMGNQVEVGIGTVVALAPFQFSRAPAGGASPINFGAGSKDVEHVVTAAEYNKFQAVRQIAFAAAVPLTAPGLTLMAPKAMTGNLAITIAANPVAGAQAWAPIIGDGSSSLTVSGAKKLNFSMDFDNRAGIENQLQLFYDGRYAWYSISQELDAQPVDLTPPTEVSALVANSTPTYVDIQFSEAMDTNHTPPASTITISGHAVTALAFISAIVARATVSAAFVNGEAARTLAYAASGSDYFRDAAGNALADFSNKPITNNVGVVATVPGAPTIGAATAGDTTASFPFTAPASNGGAAITGYELKVYKVSDNSLVNTFTGASSPIGATGLTNNVAVYGKVDAINSVGPGAQSAASNNVTPAVASADRFGALVLTTESGTGPYSYVGDATGPWDNAKGGIYQKKFVLDTDGGIKIRLDAYSAGAGNFVMIGLTNSATPVGFSSLAFYVYTNSSAGIYTGSNGAKVNDVVPAVGDIMWFRRTGTTHTLDISKDGGATFTTAWQFTATASAYNIQVIPNKAGGWTTVSSSGLA